MASESAFIGFPMHPAYCSSKAAVMHLSKSMASRYASEKIRVNALCPGTIETDLVREFFAGLPNPTEACAEVERMHPLGIGEPRDIAWAAVYLASDESKYTTGSAMLVDGGSTAI
jgi:NAD(P)-dependent dehydrogenase (short-subunit alcohol dehydrogenase family)